MFRAPLLASLLLALLFPDAEAQNLASGLPASFDPAPNYTLCTDPGDAVQLTDGRTHSGEKAYLWTGKGAVGWSRPKEPIFITFDLGAAKRIGSVAFHSAAGAAGVVWPAAVGLFLSDDGEHWAYAGEFTAGSLEEGVPEPMRYAEHRFILRNLNAEARHVALGVLRGGSACFFIDEVEILEGGGSIAAAKLPRVGDRAAARRFLRDLGPSAMLARRLALDHGRVLRALRASNLAVSEKEAFETRLREIVAQSAKLPPAEPTLRTQIPINALQARLLALHGELLEKEGFPRLLLTKTHRNAHLGWLERPASRVQEPVALEYHQMRGEARGDLLLATNASGIPATATFTLNVPKEAVAVFYCPWADTPQLEPVATALLPVQRGANGWEIPLPPGVTTKVWVSVDGAFLPPGEHRFEGSMQTPEGPSVPVRLSARISPVKMERPGLHLGMWDYLDGNGSYGITPANRDAALRLMRSHGVDSPWATSATLPMPVEADFDADDRLLPGRLDFSRFDAWLKLWSDARRYMVFLNVKDRIGDAKIGSPRFAPRVEAWAQAVWEHAGARGVRPGQLFLELVDEPKTDAQDQRLVAWAEPIRDAVPELKIWSNPVWLKPGASSLSNAFEIPDVLSPNAGTLAKGGKETVAFYQARRAEGKPMEIYACSALAPHADPNRYFRMLPWSGWRLRVQAVGFWSFGDTGGLADCWNAYGPASGIWFSPVFLGREGATDTLHWQAVREGVLDYEYLRMLEQALPGIADAALRKEAQTLLSDEAVQALFRGWAQADSAAWSGSGGHEAPDLHRQKILAVLERLHR